MFSECLFAMRTIGGIVSALAIVDGRDDVAKWLAFVGDGLGDQRTGLSSGQRRIFF